MKFALMLLPLLLSGSHALAEQDCSIVYKSETVHVRPSASTLKAWADWGKAHLNYHPISRPVNRAEEIGHVKRTCAQIQADTEISSKSVDSEDAPAFDSASRAIPIDFSADDHLGGSEALRDAARGGNYSDDSSGYPETAPFGGPGFVTAPGGGTGTSGPGGSTGPGGGTGPTVPNGGNGGNGPTGPGGGDGGTDPGGPVGGGGVGPGDPGGPAGEEPPPPIAPTPEPTSLIFLATGLLGMAKLVWKTK